RAGGGLLGWCRSLLLGPRSPWSILQTLPCRHGDVDGRVGRGGRPVRGRPPPRRPHPRRPPRAPPALLATTPGPTTSLPGSLCWSRAGRDIDRKVGKECR